MLTSSRPFEQGFATEDVNRAHICTVFHDIQKIWLSISAKRLLVWNEIRLVSPVYDAIYDVMITSYLQHVTEIRIFQARKD